MKRTIAIALCALCFCAASLPCAFASGEKTVNVRSGRDDIDITIPADVDLTLEEIETITNNILISGLDPEATTPHPNTEKIIETTIVAPEPIGSDKADPQPGDDGDKCTSHKLVTTTAYYTRHLAYATNPRCAVYTFSVTTCTKCSYIEKKLVSTERVSYCHPEGGIAPGKGDANADGKVNAKDVVAVMRKIVGTLPGAAKFDKSAADMDENGKINSKDVVLIMKRLVGNI